MHGHPVDPAAVGVAGKLLPSSEESAAIAGRLSLLADATRLRTLQALQAVPELCVGDLALAIDASADAIGYALRLLRTAGYVRSRRAGRVNYYRLGEEFPRALLVECVAALASCSPEPEVAAEHGEGPHGEAGKPEGG